jgi:hypothetical protein
MEGRVADAPLPLPRVARLVRQVPAGSVRLETQLCADNPFDRIHIRPR